MGEAVTSARDERCTLYALQPLSPGLLVRPSLLRGCRLGAAQPERSSVHEPRSHGHDDPGSSSTDEIISDYDSLFSLPINLNMFATRLLRLALALLVLFTLPASATPANLADALDNSHAASMSARVPASPRLKEDHWRTIVLKHGIQALTDRRRSRVLHDWLRREVESGGTEGWKGWEEERERLRTRGRGRPRRMLGTEGDEGEERHAA